MTTTLYLIRHGETEWNRTGRWQGHADVPLSSEGRDQAWRLARRLRDEEVHFDHLYASDLSRAFETAQIVARALEIPLRPLSDLREINVGLWSGLTRAEIMGRYPGTFDADASPPGGESREAFGDRVGAALLRLADQHPDQVVGLVTHGGTIRAMLRHVAQLGADLPPLEHIGNTSITIVQFEAGRWRVARFNNMDHLEGDQAPDMLAPENEAGEAA